MLRIARFEKVSPQRFVNDWISTFPQQTIEQAVMAYEHIQLPRRATSGSAGYDFFAPVGFELPAGGSIKIPTGVRALIEDGWVLTLYPRSGLGFKFRFQLDNTVGVIDSDYAHSDNEGHIFMRMTNDSREGKVLPGNIIKIDGFLNHRVDTKLLGDIADEFAKYFDTSKVTVVLTAEASGIALATACAERYGVPMLFAKKAKSDNIESGLIQSEIFSYTYKKKVTLLVSQEWLSKDDRVLIIDDFMANGYAMGGLVDIVKKAGAQLVGIGVAVEKGFQGGGDKFRAMKDVPYKALAVIESASAEDGITFREDD